MTAENSLARKSKCSSPSVIGHSTTRSRADLLLTDVVMRGMSGPELVEHLNGSHKDLKVIYMSGYTGELAGERGTLKGGPLLEKPFTRTALLNMIHTILS